MKLMRCELIGLLQHYQSNIFTAKIKRLEDHPRLGPPKSGAFTVTSAIRSIDFDKGLIVTENNLYSFKSKGRFDD
jgi:hypothetical protein